MAYNRFFLGARRVLFRFVALCFVLLRSPDFRLLRNKTHLNASPLVGRIGEVGLLHDPLTRTMCSTAFNGANYDQPRRLLYRMAFLCVKDLSVLLLGYALSSVLTTRDSGSLSVTMFEYDNRCHGFKFCQSLTRLSNETIKKHDSIVLEPPVMCTNCSAIDVFALSSLENICDKSNRGGVQLSVRRRVFLSSANALLGIFLLLAVAVSNAFAQEEIEYAYPDISVWTTERDSEGKLKNPLVKLAEPLFEKAGIPWRARAYPAKRMFSNLREGVSRFSMLVKAESILQGCCLVSHEPVAIVEIRVFHDKNMPRINSKEDLVGKSVITIRGYSYAGTRKFINDKKIENHEAPNHFAAFSMLEKGRADYVIDYANPASEVLAINPIGDLTFSTLKQTNVYLILHKSYPNAKNVMKRLEEIVQELDKGPFLTPPNLIASHEWSQSAE